MFFGLKIFSIFFSEFICQILSKNVTFRGHLIPTLQSLIGLLTDT